MPQQPNSAWTPVDESTAAWTPVDESTPPPPGFFSEMRSTLGIPSISEAGSEISGYYNDPSSFLPAAGRAIAGAPGRYLEAQRGAAQAGINRMAQPGIGNKVAGAAEYVLSPLMPGLARAGQDIEQGNVRGGLGATTGAVLPFVAGSPEMRASAAEAAKTVASKIPSPTTAVIEHPVLTRAATTAAGGVLGRAGGGVGEFGGVYGGYRIGGEIVKYADQKAISQVIDGTRTLDKLPTRLMPQYVRELTARANAYARQAIETGQNVESMKLPKGLKEATQTMYQEQMKMIPQIPRAVLTPEEIQAARQQGVVSRAATEQMRPEAQARGMAHAAGQHQGVWKPAVRGISQTTTKSYKLEPQPPPRSK